MPMRSPSTRSQEPRYRDDAVATASARAVGKETRIGSPEESSPLAPFPRTRLGTARGPWAAGEVTDALGLSGDQEKAPAAPALDAMSVASPAEVQLARWFNSGSLTCRSCRRRSWTLTREMILKIVRKLKIRFGIDGRPTVNCRDDHE
jgi:hypothetical protein